MPPLLRLAIRVLLIVAIVGFAVQPYNWYCQLSQSCKSFKLSYYIPKSEGKKEFKVEVETENYYENVKLSMSENNHIKTPTNRKHVVTFRIKNLAKKRIILRPKLIIEPAEIAQYVNVYECPCRQQVKLISQQEVELRLEFDFEGKFEKLENFGRIIEEPIKLRIKI